MRRRWLHYILIGVAFGVFDFYYHGLISNALLLWRPGSPAGLLAWAILGVGIWLVPVVPVVLHEVKTSHSRWLSALAAAVTWSASVIAYYLNNAVQLAFIGVPSRPEMHISNRGDPYFWTNWQTVLINTLLISNIIWLVVALVGGCIVGFALSALYLRRHSGNFRAAQSRQ